MARQGLLEHGTALGDVVRYDHSGPVTSGQKRNKGYIVPGQCGFRGCTDDRVGGVWAEGGSYMCAIHRMLFDPLRIRKREGLKQKKHEERMEEMDSES